MAPPLNATTGGEDAILIGALTRSECSELEAVHIGCARPSNVRTEPRRSRDRSGAAGSSAMLGSRNEKRNTLVLFVRSPSTVTTQLGIQSRNLCVQFGKLGLQVSTLKTVLWIASISPAMEANCFL